MSNRTYFAARFVAQEARRAPKTERDAHQALADGAKERWTPCGARMPATGPADPFAHMCWKLGLPVPVREFRFSYLRRWRFDYAWPDHKLALEVEGGIWRKGGGAHSHPLNIERDIEKYNDAALRGWRILRVAPEKLYSDGWHLVRQVFDSLPPTRRIIPQKQECLE